jgi:hypothetical protein
MREVSMKIMKGMEGAVALKYFTCTKVDSSAWFDVACDRQCPHIQKVETRGIM